MRAVLSPTVIGGSTTVREGIRVARKNALPEGRAFRRFQSKIQNLKSKISYRRLNPLLRKSVGWMVVVVLLASSAAGVAQERAQTPGPGSPERKAVLDALRVPVEKRLKRKVVFKVDELKVLGGWAFVRGVPQQPGGRPMDYSGTPYQQQVRDGAFDDGFSALLRSRAGKWTVVTYNIGATDVVWSDWSEKHKAPPELFGLPQTN